MTSRRVLLLGLGVLVALQLLTSFSAIGVLTRMSPAIQRILQENEYSIEAAEALLGEVAAAAGGRASPAARERARLAVERLRRNLTEPEEAGPIDEIETALGPALEGDGPALAALVGAANRLVAINRTAMREADREAQRLGTAGAWSAVVLGVVAFLLSVLVAERLNRRLLAPLLEMGRLLDALQKGDSRRRAQPGDAAPDVRRVLEGANLLLDTRAPRGTSGPNRADSAARAALLAFLDERAAPTWVVDRDGAVAAANDEGLDRLSGEEGAAIRAALAALPRERAPVGEPLVEATPLREEGWLCTLRRDGGAGTA